MRLSLPFAPLALLTLAVGAAVVPAGGVLAARKSGYLYTLTNDPARNGVAVFARRDDGSLLPVAGSPFLTGGRGAAGDDIDNQGAIRSHGDHLLAVDPGSNTIAVFRKEAGGRLAPVAGSPFPSGGVSPLSLAVRDDLVYVANQSLPGARTSTAPNVTGFRIGPDGRLTPIPSSRVEFPGGTGPAQVEFSPNGRMLAVTSGFQNAESSRVQSFRVEPDGALAEVSSISLAPSGASGPVGFSWAPDGRHLFVSNFRGSAIAVLAADPETGRLSLAGAPVPNGEQAACWTAITRDGRTLYAVNFVSNSVTTYRVEPDGKLRVMGSVARRGAGRPDSKDAELSPDGKFLYVLGAAGRQISVFRIGADGMPVELPAEQSPASVPGGVLTGLLAE